MTFYGPLLLVVLVAGLLAGYFILRQQIRSEISQLRKLVESAAAEKPDGARLVGGSVSFAESPVSKELPKPKAVAPQPSPRPVKDEITPEILAVIAAAVAQFVGAGARIRSTRMIPVAEGNVWAQQGRVIIQASHNLAMR